MPKRKRRMLWGLVGLLVLASVVVLLALGPERLAKLVEEPGGMTAFGSLNTIGFRFEVWRWALAGIQDFPFTGCGLGHFRQVVRLLYPLNVDPGYDIAHAHNIFLQIALDVGLPGLMAYLAMLGIVAVTTWRTASLLHGAPTSVIGDTFWYTCSASVWADRCACTRFQTRIDILVCGWDCSRPYTFPGTKSHDERSLQSGE